jgi:hypothetical protein
MIAASVGHPEFAHCLGPHGQIRTGKSGRKWGKIGKNSTNAKENCGKSGFCLDFVPSKVAL